MEAIKLLERCSAPVLVALSAMLLAWAVGAAGGVGPMLSAPSQFAEGMPKAGRFWAVFLPAVTANIGYWATLSVSISDFSRWAAPPCMAGSALQGPACACGARLSSRWLCPSVRLRHAPCRYAVSQRAQLLGQAIGLPPTMAAFSLMGGRSAGFGGHVASARASAPAAFGVTRP
jgi:NCS1 family nucleobase:cation symporter-1